MTTFNTGNPIGSTDARDRSDNSENLDLAVNSLDQTFVDRLGVTRDTLEGIYQKSAYYRAGTFDAGYTLTNNRQTLAYGNVEYSWSGAFPKVVVAGSTPATSGGVGAGAWVDRTDVTLRGDLEPTTREAIRRSYAEAGYTMVAGSFSDGGTLTSETDVLLHKTTGVAYSWGGTFPKSVAANTDPTSTGSGYMQCNGALLRDQLAPLNKAVHSATIVRPVFVRQTCTTTNNSAVVSVQNASQFAVGDNILLCAGGSQQYSGSINVQGSPARNGTIYLVLDGYLISNISVFSSDTAVAVAAKLRAVTVSGWTISGSGTVATFVKNTPGLTVGMYLSDIDLVGLPYLEVINTDPTYNMIAAVKSINIGANQLTLETNAQYTGDGLCYIEHGKALSAATKNGTVSIVMDGGEYLFHDGLKFTSDFTGIIGGQNGDITIYAIGGKDVPVIECEKPSAGEAYYGSLVNNIFIDMQNARRPGIVGRRLWDASSWDNVLVDRVNPFYTGISIRRHSSQSAPTTANDQTVVSQSVCMRGVHAISRSPMAGVPIYMEFVQEASLNNVKGVFAADYNSVALASTTSIGVQLEACRGVVGVNMSAAGAKDGVVITSITGEARGITLVGPTLETNENNVDVRGGVYDIQDVNIINPRTIGGGTGLFRIQRLTRGRIECGDRPINIGASVKAVHGVVDGAAAATSGGAACYITRTSIPGTNVTTHTYASGLSLSCGGNRMDLLTTGLDLVAEGAKVGGYNYPWTANETGMLLMVNKSGTQVLSRVFVGPEDSAQSGFRALRVLN